MIEDITIPNGINWSRDSKTLYFADSPTRNLYAFDYDIETGTISNRRVFYQVDEGEGEPDGHAVDEEGHIWQAIYGAGKVVRISPEGKVVAEILLPTRCPTCPCFVGEELYITTAKEEQPEKYPESVELSGSLFKCHVGVKGVQIHRFKYDRGGA
jgi:sugar lactone lactonase YvrE